jgi:hypothetical protein
MEPWLSCTGTGRNMSGSGVIVTLFHGSSLLGELIHKRYIGMDNAL